MEKIVFPENPVLIVDDEIKTLEGFIFMLKMGGLDHIVCCQDSRRVMPILDQQEVGVVLLDLTMPFLGGEKLLEEISRHHPQVPVIIVTGTNDIDIAVKCMQKGAMDYIVKPVEESRLIGSVKKAVEFRELREENRLLKEKIFLQKLDYPEAFYDIITRDKKMESIFQYMEAIKKTSEPVLITGETGTGKELVARAFHSLSRRNGKFVAVNLGGLDDQMFSDTLFGHRKGAFTDAARDRAGFIESAAAGTLFLDEIGDLSPQSQVKLLRLLQEKEYYPLGEDEPRYSDALIIAATNRNLFELVKKEKFRKDLFYRLDVHHVALPPLRERLGDLPLLLDHFFEDAARTLEKKKPTPPAELLTLLSTYYFPGNIRELRSMVFKAVSRHRSKMLGLETFKEHIQQYKPGVDTAPGAAADSPAWLQQAAHDSLPTLKEAQKMLIQLAMKRAGNNQSVAAQLLGITKQALSKRLKK